MTGKEIALEVVVAIGEDMALGAVATGDEIGRVVVTEKGIGVTAGSEIVTKNYGLTRLNLLGTLARPTCSRFRQHRYVRTGVPCDK